MMNARAYANISEQANGDVVNSNYRENVLSMIILLKISMIQGMITLPNVVVKVSSLFNERRSIDEYMYAFFRILEFKLYPLF